MTHPTPPKKVRMLLTVGGYNLGDILTVDDPAGQFMGHPHIPVPADQVDAYVAAGYVERIGQG